MKLAAICNYILIEEIDYKDRTVDVGGMVLHIAGEKMKNETGKGKIVALGSESQELEIGDVVYFNRYIPHEVVID
jgi:co-chaperonin GroES (HSP10)